MGYPKPRPQTLFSGSGDSGLSSDSSEKDSGDNGNKDSSGAGSMERNVLREEETGDETDQKISVDAFRRRFCASDASVRKVLTVLPAWPFDGQIFQVWPK